MFIGRLKLIPLTKITFRMLSSSPLVNSSTHLTVSSEQGQENSNKFLRFYRKNLARKTSQATNLNDCLVRLWLRSDPIIRNARKLSPCSRCDSCEHNTVSCPTKVSVPDSSTATNEEYFMTLLTYDD